MLSRTRILMQILQLRRSEIVSLLGLESYSKTEQEKRIKDMFRVLEERLLARILLYFQDNHPEKLDEFKTLIEGKEDERTISEWLHQAIPSLPEWAREEIHILQNSEKHS